MLKTEQRSPGRNQTPLRHVVSEGLQFHVLFEGFTVTFS